MKKVLGIGVAVALLFGITAGVSTNDIQPPNAPQSGYTAEIQPPNAPQSTYLAEIQPPNSMSNTITVS